MHRYVWLQRRPRSYREWISKAIMRRARDSLPSGAGDFTATLWPPSSKSEETVLPSSLSERMWKQNTRCGRITEGRGAHIPQSSLPPIVGTFVLVALDDDASFSSRTITITTSILVKFFNVALKALKTHCHERIGGVYGTGMQPPLRYTRHQAHFRR